MESTLPVINSSLRLISLTESDLWKRLSDEENCERTNKVTISFEELVEYSWIICLELGQPRSLQILRLRSGSLEIMIMNLWWEKVLIDRRLSCLRSCTIYEYAVSLADERTAQPFRRISSNILILSILFPFHSRHSPQLVNFAREKKKKNGEISQKQGNEGQQSRAKRINSQA